MIREGFLVADNADPRHPRYPRLRYVLCAVLLLTSCQRSAPFIEKTVVPLSFEENRGQANPAVHFFAASDQYTVFLAAPEVVIAPRHSPGHAFRMRFIDGQAARIFSLEPTGQMSHYLLGNDPGLWKTGVQHFARIRYENIYPDTDLIYYGENRQLRYDFVLKPGAKPGNIRFAIEDADQLSLSGSGDLVIQAASGEFRFGPGTSSVFVRVLGSGFTSNSVVRINGEARTTSFPRQGELNVTLPAADIAAIGSLRLEVFTPPPGGGLSNALTFSVIATPDPPVVGIPAITELSPASVPALSNGFAFTVYGSGFVSGRSAIYWNDTPVFTVFVNANIQPVWWPD